MLPAIASLAVAFALSWGIVRLGQCGLGIDYGIIHLRKLHDSPVPRIGGVALLCAVGIGAALLYRKHTGAAAPPIVGLLACALPCFAGGLADDIRGGVPARLRLALMAVSSLLAWWMIDLRVTRVDLALVDPVLRHATLNVALTLAGMMAITNGINLVDGLNGLAGVTCASIFAGLVASMLMAGDTAIALSAGLVLGAIVGFLGWNFPRGRLFLGDGGAYLLGFLAGGLSILAVTRNAAISAWFAPLLLAYPLTEVGFSIWRRSRRRRRDVTAADAAHLHHLIYRRLIRPRSPVGTEVLKERRNSVASAVLWPLCAAPALAAALLYDTGPALATALAIYVALYVRVYLTIARMRVPPSWLIRLGRTRYPQ